MATQIFRKISYGLSEPLIDNGQGPIIAKRDPDTNDKALVGTEWINSNDNNAFFLTSVVDNVATWVPIVNTGVSPTFDADSGSASPVADVIRISGSGITSTSASGNTVVINTPVTNFVTSAGTATPSSNTLNIIGGTGVSTTGSGSTVTVSLSGGAPVDSVNAGNSIAITGPAANPIVNVGGTTNHAVQIGNLSNSLTSVAVGATNTVLLGNTGADPSFGTVPNAALSNSSITLSNGQNITVTGSPVSLGGTATIALSGVVPIANGGTNASSMATTDGTVYFDGTRLVTTATGSAGQILTSGGPGVAPSYQTGSASSISITGNTGGALTGSAFTFTGGTTGLAFNGAGTTETIGGTLVVANGGTGAATLTSNGVLLGNGTSAVTTVAVGTTGQVLTGVTGSAPTFQAPAASSISITGNSGGALTGNAFTLTGGTTGLTFAGSGTTETLGGTLVVANGGTGVATIAAHSLLIGEGTSAVANTGAGTAGQIMVSGGASADPAWVTPTAGTGLTVTENATTQSYALSVPVSIANGGTNATSMATTDGVVYFDGTRLVTTAVGTATQVLTSNGAGVAPTFQAASGGSGITSITGNTGAAQTGPAIVLTTGASNINGTATFQGSGNTITLAPTDGNNNTAWGKSSMDLGVISGTASACFGYQSGQNLSSGGQNTLIGAAAGSLMTSTSANCAVGLSALGSATTGGGENVALGYTAGGNLLTGTKNVLVGAVAGGNYTSSEAENICIGYSVQGTAAETHTLRIGNGTGSSLGTGQLNQTFISGIQGITVTGTAVLVSSSNQLGIAVSSQRFKNDIQPMAEASNAIYKLRPVTFTWDRDSAPGLADASTDRQCGLIAEEVAQVFPQIVGFDKEGKPLNVNYGDLTSLLVNEIQKLSARIAALEASSFAKATADGGTR